jgi:hypothetical protein
MIRVNRSRNYNSEPLTNEQIQTLAPSAFAGQAYEKQSDRYAFIPTTSVIDTLRNAGYLPVAASQSTTRVDGKQLFTKHMIRFQARNQDLTAVGDSRLEAVLINSHDGTSAYHLSLGVFRLVCSNGMVVADSLVESIRVRHTGNIVEQVLDGTVKMFENVDVVRETIRKWQQIRLSEAEQVFLAEAAHSLRFENTPHTVEPKRLLTVNRSADQGEDLWRVTNRIQENVIRGGQRFQYRNDNNQFRRSRTRAVTGIDQDTKLNKAIWELSAKMAELKQVK